MRQRIRSTAPPHLPLRAYPRHAHDTPTTRPRHVHDTSATRPRHVRRGVADGSLRRWVSTVQRWDFERVVPAHLDAPIALGPAQFAEPFDFARDGGNEVRFCDEDVALLREAEKGPLSFSVGTTALGPLTGAECALGNSNPRIVSAPGWTPLTGGLKWTPK